jgi:hypothetical protein
MKTFTGDLKLYEISLVLKAANPHCKIISIKEK